MDMGFEIIGDFQRYRSQSRRGANGASSIFATGCSRFATARQSCWRRCESVETLKHLKARLQNGPEKIIDMRLARVEVEHGDAAFDAEIDFCDAWHGAQCFAQSGKIFLLEIADRKNRGFRRRLRHGELNLTEV